MFPKVGCAPESSRELVKIQIPRVLPLDLLPDGSGVRSRDLYFPRGFQNTAGMGTSVPIQASLSASGREAAGRASAERGAEHDCQPSSASCSLLCLAASLHFQPHRAYFPPPGVCCSLPLNMKNLSQLSRPQTLPKPQPSLRCPPKVSFLHSTYHSLK